MGKLLYFPTTRKAKRRQTIEQLRALLPASLQVYGRLGDGEHCTDLLVQNADVAQMTTCLQAHGITVHIEAQGAVLTRFYTVTEEGTR